MPCADVSIAFDPSILVHRRAWLEMRIGPYKCKAPMMAKGQHLPCEETPAGSTLKRRLELETHRLDQSFAVWGFEPDHRSTACGHNSFHLFPSAKESQYLIIMSCVPPDPAQEFEHKATPLAYEAIAMDVPCNSGVCPGWTAGESLPPAPSASLKSQLGG